MSLSRSVGAATTVAVLGVSALAVAERARPQRDAGVVDVRSKAQQRSKVVARLEQNESVEVVRERKGWKYVRLDNGLTGWVKGEKLAEVAPAATLRTSRVAGSKDVPPRPVAYGDYRIYMFDMGTGLSVLVQGTEFTLLYDGGSIDGKEVPDRLLAYLFATVGPSGGDGCVPGGDDWNAEPSTLRIDHLILSHAAREHASALPRVMECYSVANVWDQGVGSGDGEGAESKSYTAFLEAVAAEQGVSYHTYAAPDANARLTIGSRQVPLQGSWVRFSEGGFAVLDDVAGFTVLDSGVEAQDPSSIVIRVDLGGASMLLTGDADSGRSGRPDDPPDGAEKRLVAQHSRAIDVDILQVGHHGSDTGTRTAFVDVVSPSILLLSAGPYDMTSARAPSEEVVDALAKTGATLLRTDVHDSGPCDDWDHVGDDVRGPGGCDAYLIEVDNP
ncbi:MAG: SH3 domain-containing protein [Kofleriaceae bacterium]|nr:SH3 domain-containing protein [Kofleriaceae bacterium]MCB9572507.1 SH3 domain-containing protein [Kofleriaceae bacterium]